MRKPEWLNRGVVVMALAESVSGMGSWLTMMALVTRLILRGQGGIAESSGILLAGMLPMLLVSPLAGRLADHWDRRWLMVGSELLSGLAVVGLLFVRATPGVYSLVAFQAAASTLLRPARLAAFKSLVPAAHLTRANAFLNQASSAIKVLAPALGGMIVALVGPLPALLFDIVSYGVSAALLSTLPALPPQGHPTGGEHPAGSYPPVAREALFRVVLQNVGLRALIVTVFGAVFFVSGFDLLLVVYVKEVLHGDALLLGTLIGGLGAGAIASGGWLMLRRRTGNTWSDLRLGITLLAVLVFSLAAGAWVHAGWWVVTLLVASTVVGGIGNGLMQIQYQTLIQEFAPAEHLGGMAGVSDSVAVAARLLAIAVVPLLVPRSLSLAWFFALSSLGLALVTVVPHLMSKGVTGRGVHTLIRSKAN